MEVIIASESEIAIPAAGTVNIFINSDKGNILYARYPDGSFKPYNGDFNSADIAKTWVDKVTCSLFDGTVTPTDFGSIMAAGFTATSTTSVDGDGNVTSTISVGSRSGS